jgi:hypothetical protein
LAGLFGIEIGFHCEMANHIHLILRTRPDVVQAWSDQQVVQRWLQITALTCHFADTPVEVSEAKVQCELANPERVLQLRRRLSSVSWLMACLTEYVSRRANAEDGCTGRFWEGRFKCRDVADLGAILICGIYVDLNSIRAGEALAPEQARYTSAYDRIQGWQERQRLAQPGGSVQDAQASSAMPADGWLCELTLIEGPQADVREGLHGSTPWRASDKGLLPIRWEDYLCLLDWTGRELREDKPGAIPAHLAGVLERLGMRPGYFLESVRGFEKWFGRAVGSVKQLLEIAARTGRRWLRGQQRCEQLFG